MVLKTGETLGPYEIVGTLGQGGMAVVYKGYHPRLDRYVAIKILHHVFLNDPSYVTRFEREAQIVARLEHPHIVPVYDFAEHNGQPYLVMKFIEGRTLKSILAGGGLPPAEIVRVMSALAGALDYAHAHGVLHRDIKPSNILIDRAGVPYLSDFGLARIAAAGESTISKDMLLGTPQYVAPEQAQGSKALDARTDLYSFGVVLYELLVGRVPFSAGAPYAILHDQIYTPLPAPDEANPGLSPSVAAVLLKALTKEPANRYGSAGEMIGALENALTPSPSPSGRGEKAATASAVAAPGIASAATNGRSGFHGGEATPPVTPNYTFDSARPHVPSTAARPVPTSKPTPPGRRWLIGGGIVAAIFLLLVVLNLLGAAHDFIQAAPPAKVAAQVPTAAPTSVSTPATSPTLKLIDVPDLSASTLQIDLAAYPREPSYRIAQARVLWKEGQIDQARDALDSGAKVAEYVGASVAVYYLSAAAAAERDNAPDAAAYADIQALRSVDSTSVEYAPVRALAGQSLYQLASGSNNLTVADLRGLTDKAGGTSPLIDTMMVRALISETRYGLAQTAIDRLIAQNPTLAEAHLVLGDLYAARGNTSRANEEWKSARQAADAPDWVIQQAKSSQNSST